ncbi:MAG: glycerate kinase [Fimbriimonadales bacterium]
MRVLVAPTAYKGTLSPIEAAQAIAEGVQQAFPDAEIDLCPIADGGDGWLEVWEFHAEGNAQHIPVQARDPLGNPIATEWLLFQERVAVIESARVCGLKRLSYPAPLEASTEGVGDLLRSAVEHPQVEEIWLGLGGSATTDAGVGALRALGFQTLDTQSQPIPPGGQGLSQLERIVPPATDPLQGKSLILCADVENLITGEHGSARVFGPQKGATPDQVAQLEAGLEQFRKVALYERGRDLLTVMGSGSAGGMGGGLHAYLNAPIVSGVAWLLRQIRWQERLASASLLITGEGQVDHQTLMGKGVGIILQQAVAQGVPVWVVAGRKGEGWQAVENLPKVRVSAASELNPHLSPAQALQEATVSLGLSEGM